MNRLPNYSAPAHVAQHTQQGFTLFELLLVLAIIAIMAGFGMSYMPRILSGDSVAGAARRLAGAGYEARHMALLQQRPWELIIDMDTGEFAIGPIEALSRRERAKDAADPTTASPTTPSADQTLAIRNRLARENQKKNTGNSIKKQQQWDVVNTFTEEEDFAFISEHQLPEGVQVKQVAEGLTPVISSRVSLVFTAKGFSAPLTIWLDEQNAENDKEQHTVYFPGLMAPEVVRGFLLPEEDGRLSKPTDEAFSGEAQSW